MLAIGDVPELHPLLLELRYAADAVPAGQLLQLLPDQPLLLLCWLGAAAEDYGFFLGLRAEGYFVCRSSSSICSCRCCRPKYGSSCCSGRFYLRERLRLQLLLHGSIHRCTLVSFSARCRRGL